MHKGWNELGRRSGKIAAIRSQVVWDNDLYSYEETTSGPKLLWKPGDEDKRQELVCVWVRWQERVGPSKWLPQVIEVPRSRIERAKKASPAYQKGVGPWFTHEDEMWRKTGDLAAHHFWPLTPELAMAASADDHIVRDVIADESGAAQADVIEADAGT